MALPRKIKKPISEYKLASLPEYHQQRIRADEAKAKAAQVQGSSLKSFSSKRLKRFAGKTLHSTFTAKPAKKILAHKFETKTGRVIRSVRQGLKPAKQGLKAVGVRGKRLAPGDRREASKVKGLQCICGCNLKPQWGHLETRSNEATRHVTHLSAPVCEYLHPWLDQGPGVTVRAEMFRMAQELQRRLTHEDVFQMLVDAGYYAYVARGGRWRDECPASRSGPNRRGGEAPEC